MKVIGSLMVLLTVVTLAIILFVRPDEHPTEAELVELNFPNGPHWIVRAVRGMGPAGLGILAIDIAFAICLCVFAIRARKGQGSGPRPLLLASQCLLPCCLGIVYTFALLRLAPYYAGEGGYLLDLLGRIRVVLFASLVSALAPAAVLLVAARTGDAGSRN